MTRRIVVIDEPESIEVAAVDLEEERAYVITAQAGPDAASVVLGAEQVAVLADRLSALVDELERRGLVAIDTAHDVDVPMVGPGSDAFHAQTLLIGWDEDLDRLVVEAWSAASDDGVGESAHAEDEDAGDESPDDDPLGPDIVRIRISPTRAQGFIRRSRHILAANRPTCPLCGEPLGSDRHRCKPLEDAARDG